MNIGVFGGTFDPIHTGHVVIAEEARLRLGLSQVVFIPAGDPWLKHDRVISPITHRLEMIKLAIGSNPHFKVSTVDLYRAGPSYSVDTLTDLNHELGETASFYLILGLDTMAQFAEWREPQRIIEMCRLVAAKRPGATELDVAALERRVPGISRRLILLDNPEIGTSSSEVRERVAKGLSIRNLVPDAVERYIREHGLYVTNS
jgi:nicotinate-nucleotide adenylyltransferase